LKFICYLVLTFCQVIPLCTLAAGSSQTDSLVSLLKVSKGKSKIKILNELSFQFSETDPKLAINYGEQAYELATQSKEAELEAEALENIGRGYFSAGDFPGAIHYLTLSLNDYLESGDRLQIAKITQNLGLAYLMTSDFVQAQDYLLKAETQFEETGDLEQLAGCLTNVGLVSYYKGDYSVALTYYEKASEIYLKINNPAESSELLNRIAMTYWSLGINDKALHYMLEFIKLINGGRPKALGIGYNNIGAIYKDLGDNEKALEFYRKAADYYELAGDSLDLPSPLTNIGNIFSSKEIPDSALYYYSLSLRISDAMDDRLQSAKTKHNIALLCIKTGKFDEAGKLLKEYMDISREVGYKEGIAQSLLSLGNYYENLGDTSEAIQYYQDCIALADSIKLLQILKNAHLGLSEAMLNRHRYKEALEQYKKYAEVKDSIYNSEKARIITELQTRYETEKKQQENKLLIKNNELKDRRISALYMIIGGFIILTISIVILIIQYRKITLGKKLLAESEAARLFEKVDYQKHELADGALALSRNLSFIGKLLTDLKSLSNHVDEAGTRNLASIIRNIQRLDADPAWNEFELRFQNVHTRFYDNLTREFPNLTANEMRLCALIKLGMNTKDISTVTFQNIRAIEAARLRLRKKLNLDGAEDLTTFLLRF
jgi:tetratricopeptide (TPR) repeat protein